MSRPIPQLTAVEARRLLRELALADGASVRYGMHLAGPGPARRGWARYSAAGDVSYLGRTAIDVIVRPPTAELRRAIDAALGLSEETHGQA